MPLRNIKLTLSYDGTDFHGWQVQPDKPSIQGALAQALERLTGERLLPQGSGRTDAGVHALAQVATFQASSSIPLDNLRKALNGSLPDTIRILLVEEAPPDFHARHCAKVKTYRYRIFRGEVCPPFLARYVTHHPYPLHLGAMEAAAESIIGEHDFTSFAAVDPDKSSGSRAPVSNFRTVFESRWAQDKEELIYTVRGNGFLHHMVRNLVGTFLLVGKGSLVADDISPILAAKDRSASGPTAPPQGLYLVNVEY